MRVVDVLFAFDDRLGLTRPTDAPARGARLVIHGLDDARALLRRFARGNVARLRSVVGRLGGDAVRLSDAEVQDQVARALVAGRLSAHLWSDPLLPPRPPEKVEETPKPAPRSLTWVEIQLVDDDGDPVADEAFILHLPDGTEVPGRLDAKGRAFVDQIPGGQCKVTFPDLDGSEWKPT